MLETETEIEKIESEYMSAVSVINSKFAPSDDDWKRLEVAEKKYNQLIQRNQCRFDSADLNV